MTYYLSDCGKKIGLLKTAVVATEIWDCACEGNQLYYPVTNELFYFKNAANIHAYSIAGKTWRTIAPVNAGTRDFAVFNVETNSWTTRAITGIWPPAKAYACLEYNSRWDVYMLGGGRDHHDTWIYNPKLSAWTELTTATSPTNAGVDCETAYDSAKDLYVRFASNVKQMWLMRYTPSGVQAIRKTGNRRPLQAIVQYLRSGAVIRIDVSNYAAVFSCRNPLRIALYDATGRVVKEAMFFTPSFEWDAKAMNPGIYLLRIQTKDGQFQKPVILYN